MILKTNYILFSFVLIYFLFLIPITTYAEYCNSSNILGSWISINPKPSITLNIMGNGDVNCLNCPKDMDAPIAWELQRDNRWRYANYYNLFFYSTKSWKYNTLCEISPNGKIMTMFLNKVQFNFKKYGSDLPPIPKPVYSPPPIGETDSQRRERLNALTGCVEQCNHRLKISWESYKECYDNCSKNLH